MKRLGFTYIHCNDLQKMKDFYSEVLGLDCIWEDDESLAYQIGDHQLSIRVHKDMPTPEKEFAIQEGWTGGTSFRPSWSIECDQDSFKSIARRANEKAVESYYPEHKWVGYWSLPLLDPMNNTIEITCPDSDLN